ncbi:UNVERIFIED_CONTAM: hypothetical protein PYX00_011269 [Menopon gallinae]|uniref:Uncharacterized protein n=1 Tax=Menopon gallinae TaxID=328185 RepID=A0AAW2H7D6_9NEOP
MEFDYRKPTLEVLELAYCAKRDKGRAEKLRAYLLGEEMLGMYEMLVAKKVLPSNKADLDALRERSAAQVARLSRTREEDPDNENHVLEIDKQMSEYFCQTLDMENAERTMARVEQQNLSSALRMDMLLCKIRMAMLLKNRAVLEEAMQAAGDLYERGCDWTRRNKFKVYEGVYLLRKGAFARAAALFSESLATFESPEICTYEKIVLYTIFTGLLSFEREELRKRIVQSSDVLEARDRVGPAYVLAETLYLCNYPALLGSLARFLDAISGEMYLERHRDMFCREVKLRAYKQLLKSYESLSLESMACIFGVSVEYVERDLARYIAADRLPCKIDRVSMTVFVSESAPNRFNELLEAGDELQRMVKKRLRRRPLVCVRSSRAFQGRLSLLFPCQTLGEGALGRVVLVQLKEEVTPDYVFLACKIIKKRFLIESRNAENVKREIDILNQLYGRPFFPKLYSVSVFYDRLCLLMEFCSGGELFRWIRRAGGLSYDSIRFYGAEVLLALRTLRSLNILYRDLKSENILLTADGHIKLVDFGMSIRTKNKAWLLAGTPACIAPEIIASRGYGPEVDIWAFGILLYEMKYCRTPFESTEKVSAEQDLYNSILNDRLSFDADVDKDYRDLVERLLCKDPERRLGSSRVEDVMEHVFFAGVDWDKMESLDVEPPAVPPMSYEGDARNFEYYKESIASFDFPPMTILEKRNPDLMKHLAGC